MVYIKKFNESKQFYEFYDIGDYVKIEDEVYTRVKMGKILNNHDFGDEYDYNGYYILCIFFINGELIDSALYIHSGSITGRMNQDEIDMFDSMLLSKKYNL